LLTIVLAVYHMNILAIDYGTKRIGLAWVETTLGVVLPYGVIQNTNNNHDIPVKLLDMIASDAPQRIVLGLPLSVDDVRSTTPNESRVRAFGALLEEQTGVPVVYIDERFSSRQADNTPGDVSRDEKSAMIMLESYLSMPDTLFRT